MIDRQSACRFWPAGDRQRAAWLFKDLFIKDLFSVGVADQGSPSRHP
jgi:hypothetical protein